LLSDLLSQLPDVESNIKPNFADIGRRDAGSISSRVTDDADDDDDTAFTHSGALTIKSSQQSLDSFFGNVGGTLGHFTESSFANAPHFEPSAVNNNNSYNYSYNNNSHFNPMYVGHLQRLTEGGGMPCETDATSDLRSFLSELGLGKYADIFHEQDVDLPMFLTLSEDDLKEIGIG